MKLTVETYKQGMKILATTYLDWKFDLNDPDMVCVWFDVLSRLISEQDFIDAIKQYTCTKEKGPASPMELQKTYFDKLPQLSPIEALSTLKGLLNLFALDTDDRRVVEILTSDESNKALYLTYCNIASLGESACNLYPNSRLNNKLEDDYICTWFITEYKRIQQSVLRDACVNQINALPCGNEVLKIGGNNNGTDN